MSTQTPNTARQHETIHLELAELKRQELVELSAAAMPVVAENLYCSKRVAEMAVEQAEAVVREIDRSMAADARALTEKREKLARKLARLRDDNERMRATLTRIADRLRCRCEPCWTDRGRHAPECLWDVAEEALEAAATPAAQKHGEHCDPESER